MLLVFVTGVGPRDDTPPYLTMLRLLAMAAYIAVYVPLIGAVRRARSELTDSTLASLLAHFILVLKVDAIATALMSVIDSRADGALALVAAGAVVATVPLTLNESLRRWMTITFLVNLAAAALQIADALAETKTKGGTNFVTLAIGFVPYVFMVTWFIATRAYTMAPTPPHLVRMLRSARRYWRAIAAVTVIYAVFAVVGLVMSL